MSGPDAVFTKEWLVYLSRERMKEKGEVEEDGEGRGDENEISGGGGGGVRESERRTHCSSTF